MQKKIVVLLLAAAILAVSLSAGFLFVGQNQPSSLQRIFIRQDGSVDPTNVPIQCSGNVYTFTDDIYATITIQKSNIVLNGMGHTLRGPYNGTQTGNWVVGDGPDQASSAAEYIIGIDFGGKNVNGITVENIHVKNFSIGMYVWTKNNIVVSNSVSDSIVGILLSGQNNTITHNYIENNGQGLFMGFNNEGSTTIPSDIVIHHNDFENNDVQLNGCNCETLNSTETPHNWDDGGEGNYWSDYNGTDATGDGIGDTPYEVDALNIDRYPLMNSPVALLAAQPATLDALIPFVLAFATLVLIVLVAVRFLRKRKH